MSVPFILGSMATYVIFGLLLFVIAALLPFLQKQLRMPSTNYKQSVIVFGGSVLVFYVFFLVSAMVFLVVLELLHLFMYFPLEWSIFLSNNHRLFALPAALILTYYLFRYVLKRYIPVRPAASCKLYTTLLVLMAVIMTPLYIANVHGIAAIRGYDDTFMITRYYPDRHTDLAWLVVLNSDDDNITEPVQDYLPVSRDLGETFMVRRTNIHENTVAIVGGEADGTVIASVPPERLQNKILFFTSNDTTGRFLWGMLHGVDQVTLSPFTRK